MDTKTAKAAMQAVLFVSGDPISLERLAQVLQMDKTAVKKLLESLAKDLEGEGSGLCIKELDGHYQMCTAPQFEPFVKVVLTLKRDTPLSQAAMEVLAIVAYNQPVTRGFVEKVRGIDSSGIILGLVARDLLEERGRLHLPGRPLLYGVTKNFLRCFGLSSTKDLPQLGEDQHFDPREPETGQLSFLQSKNPPEKKM